MTADDYLVADEEEATAAAPWALAYVLAAIIAMPLWANAIMFGWNTFFTMLGLPFLTLWQMVGIMVTIGALRYRVGPMPTRTAYWYRYSALETLIVPVILLLVLHWVASGL